MKSQNMKSSIPAPKFNYCNVSNAPCTHYT